MNARTLRKVAFRFREARAIFAGVELGLFEALDSGATNVQALAGRLGCDARGLRILLNALAAMGIVEREEERYRMAPAVVPLLVPGGPEYLGNLFLHDLWHWASWARLAEAVRGGEPIRSREADPHLADPDVLRRFLPNYNLAMEQSAGESATRFVDRVAALGPRSILDLGGGSGRMLLALLERLPAARGVLVEHAFALDRARDNQAAHPAGDRLELLGLDFERAPIPAGHDAALLSRVLMGMDAERAERVIRAAAEAIAPGGILAIHDFEPASRVGAALSLDMLLNTGGEVHGAAAVERWLERGGLSLKEGGGLTSYTRYWIARRNC